MGIRNKLGLLVAAVVVAGSLGAPSALAQTPQGDNVASEINTKDNSNVFDLSFNIRRVMAGAVDIDNAAVAVASCQDCRTIAVAIQVVLIFSDPDVVTTDNLALALNVECSSCETMALAYQYVLTTGGPVRFTAEGNKGINDILNQMREVLRTNQDMSLEEIAAQIDVLVEELYAIVDTELVAAGAPATAAERQEASDTASPTSTPSETAGSPSPTDAVPTPETTPTAESSPTTTGSPTSPESTPTEQASPATTP